MQKFAALGASRQRLLLRIWLLLAWARLRLLRNGLAHFTAGLTRHQTVPATLPLAPEQLAQAIELGRLVSIAARYTPWQSRCLTQVLVLQRLLEQRQIPGSFSLGVQQGGSKAERVFNAHAWLQCGNTIVNGAVVDAHYTTLSTFSWDVRASAQGQPCP
jgi:hypothetical protein